jgi:hypothetical protein
MSLIWSGGNADEFALGEPTPADGIGAGSAAKTEQASNAPDTTLALRKKSTE